MELKEFQDEEQQKRRDNLYILFKLHDTSGE